MIYASEYNSLIYNLRDMVVGILPKGMVKNVKAEEYTAYSEKENTDYKVSNLYVTVKDVTIIVSFDYENYNGLEIWVQNNDEGEGATVGTTKSCDAAFKFIRGVFELKKVIK